MIEFEWDEANIAHIARHDVLPHEAEEALRNAPIDLYSRIHGGELRMTQLGSTDSGRVLLVVTTPRGVRTRVVTAYPAKKKMQRFYMNETGGS